MVTPEAQAGLRVGVILNSLEVPAWQHEALRRIDALEFAEIAVILVDRTARDHVDRSPLYRLFNQLDANKQRITPDALAAVDTGALLNTVPVVTEGDHDNVLFINELRDHAVDTLVSFSGARLSLELARKCTNGALSFQHQYQDTDFPDHEAAGFWEVLTRQPYIASTLLSHDGAPDETKIAWSTRSGLNHFSHSRSRNEHLWKLAAVFPRVLRQLHRTGTVHVGGPIREMPAAIELTNLRLSLPLLRYFFWRIGQKLARKRWTEKWHLMFGLDTPLDQLQKFRTMHPPVDKFWADPFVIQRDEIYYLFIEEADVDTGTGNISVIEMDSNGRHSAPKPIIERPYHLSYPFIFEFENSLYLVPESAENETIEVYRCTQFPYEWEFDRYLMKGVSAYDTTLFEEAGMWWMFVNISEIEGASSWDELHLYYADSPLSEDWTPHCMNPVVSDVCTARPAGALFRDGGEIFRPSQNSSNRYGYGLNINRVTDLSESSYGEQAVHSFEPGWDPAVKALHSYSRCAPLTVIDAIRRVRKR